MKKLLCVVLSIVLMLAVSTTAFASTSPLSTGGTVEVSKRIYSSCYLEIPETIDLDTQNTCNIEIFNIEMLDNEIIRVMVSNLNDSGAITMSKADTDTTLDVYIRDDNENLVTPFNPYLTELDKAHISVGDKYASFHFSFELHDSYQNAEAGIYTGTMQYQISIDEVED